MGSDSGSNISLVSNHLRYARLHLRPAVQPGWTPRAVPDAQVQRHARCVTAVATPGAILANLLDITIIR